MSRIRAALALMRPANVCTAIADVTAGALYMSARWDDWPGWALLAGASALLYAGGVVLNDVCDATRDATERPERPIPSGRISRRTALTLAITLLLAGLLLAAMFSPLALTIAACLTAAIILYNAVFKGTALGTAFMGLCRALNLALGLSIVPEYRTLPGLIPLLFYMWLYVTSLTLFARDEHRTSNRRILATALTGMIVAIAGLGSLLVIVPGAHASFLIGPVLLLLFIIARVTPALRRRDPVYVQRTVGGLVLSIIFFDACIAWAARGFLWSLAVVAWIIPARLLARHFRMS